MERGSDRSHVRVFELIALDDRVARFLLTSLERTCREAGQIRLVEIDVSAHAPRMQRTLLELGFLPAAYVPAMVFADIERLDIVKMVRLLPPPEFDDLRLSDRAKAIANLVLAPLVSQRVLPEIEYAVSRLSLFHGLDPEQVRRLASTCRLARFVPGDIIIEEGGQDAAFYILLSGTVEIRRANLPVGTVGGGECLGEMSLLTRQPHSAMAFVTSPSEAAALSHRDLEALVRLRPDMGVVMFRNLASGLGARLTRAAPDSRGR